MGHDESNPAAPSSPQPAAAGGPADPAIPPPAISRIWPTALAAGFVAGMIAWLGGEAGLEAFQPPRHSDDSMRVTLQVTTRSDEAIADTRNAGLAFAILGGAFGAAMGAAGGIARRSSRREAIGAALFGSIVGAAAAVCASLAILPVYRIFKLYNPDRASKEILYPLLVHGGIWVPIGAAGGLAYARGLRIRGLSLGAAMGGIIGAVFGTLVYELAGAGLFPEAETTQYLSITWQTRLFARLAITLLAAAGVAKAVADHRASRPAAPASGV